MPRYVAFLRAINVGGRTVRMADLARHVGALGHTDVETFIASGNVIFSSRVRSGDALARTLEDALEARLGFRSETFVRPVDQVLAVAKRAASFVPKAAPGGSPHAMFLAAPLTKEQRAVLATLRSATDDFVVDEREIYWLCRTRQTESEFSNALFERKVKAKTTIRSESMLAKLAAKLRG